MEKEKNMYDYNNEVIFEGEYLYIKRLTVK